MIKGDRHSAAQRSAAHRSSADSTCMCKGVAAAAQVDCCGILQQWQHLTHKSVTFVHLLCCLCAVCVYHVTGVVQVLPSSGGSWPYQPYWLLAATSPGE
jgi:hypothetical protein